MNRLIGFALKGAVTAGLLAFMSLLLSSHVPAAHAQSSATMDEKPHDIARVLRVSIVTRDIDATTRLWSEIFSLPAPQVGAATPASLSFMDYQSTTPHTEFKRAVLQLENTQIEFVQPTGKGDSPEAQFLKNYPAGVRRVLFALADPNSTERLKKLGLSMRTQGGRDLYVEKANKFGVVTEWTAARNNESLDSMTSATASEEHSLPPAPNGGMRSMMQVALASDDLKGSSERWAEILGVPAPKAPTSGSTSWMFRGQPSNGEIIPVFIPFGSTEIEVIAVGSGDGTNNFKEYLNHRGNGVEHFAFSVDDMDATVKRFEEFGISVGLTQPPRPNADPSRPNMNLHMMNGLEKLGNDIELFHQMTCCYNQMAKMSKN